MKVSRLALLAAAPLCCAALIPAAALAAGAPAVWSDLWHTPDQQGQALLDSGHPAAAAARFQDPRRRAYADLEAGRYPQAAKLLAPFTDPQSEYNRGNALARAGQLQAALAAYDAALKQAPADKDVRHNRDLVERALRQQRQSQQSRTNRRGRGTASSGQKPSAAGQQGGSGSQQTGSGGSQSSGGGQVASNGSRAGAGHSGNSGQQPSSQSGSPAQPGASQRSAANGSGGSKEARGQAQRDAALAAAIAREQRQRGGKGGTGQVGAARRNGATQSAAEPAENGTRTGSLLAGGGTRAPKQKPETERQLALDQWLRQIPDSPAGLLRRKFLIEHMLKEQAAGGSQEPGQ